VSRARVAREDAPEKTGIEKIREINEGKWVGPGTWVGPLDEYDLEDEWNKLGAAGAKQYPADFMMSIKRGMEPDNLDDAPHVMEKFQQAVEGLSAEYLEGNLRDISKEEEKLGIHEEKPSEQNDAAVAELVVLAEKAKSLDELAKRYGTIQVGYNLEQVPEPDQDSLHATVSEYRPAHFTPGSPPEKPLNGSEGPGARPYAEVEASYAETMGALMAIANKHPSIYVALKSGQLDSIAGKDGVEPEDPRSAAKTVLAGARKAIAETKASKLDWEELKPIHAQLLRGEKNAGGMPFHEPWYREIVKDEIGDYETQQTLTDVGIGFAAAVAFIFSEIATGGMATVLWASAGLAIAGANVARKWNTYEEMKTAAAAGTSQATELISGDQVNAALLDAVIESAFFFLDAVGVAVKGIKGAAALGVKRAGAEAAEKAAGLTALKGLKSMAPDEAASAIVKSVDQVGVKGAADAAGMSVDDLLKKVPANSPAAARIKEFLKLSAEGVEPAKLPQALKTAVAGGEVIGQNGAKMAAEDVVKQAIDQLGIQRTLRESGGWKDLAAKLGPTSEVGQRLKAWRDSVYGDLRKYIESLRKAEDGTEDLIKETGTLENVTNDLDISFLGARASENKASAAQFVAGRTGLGADPATLDKLVYIGLFTDPRRMHLFDQFPQLQEKLAQRTMKFEEQLIWNDEYARYLTKAANGDVAAKQMAERISAEMEALGVAKVKGFKPLNELMLPVLAKEQDRLHAAIEAAAKAGDVGKAEGLIEELANIQAQINVKEGGGYFSAGGVRKFVTDKEGFPGARAAATAAHDLGAALDQVNKLRKAVTAFEAAAIKPPGSRNVADLAKYIKDLAKYGDRFAAAAEVIGKGPNAAALEAIADEFSQLILQARGASVHTLQELLAENMDGVIAKTRGAVAAFDEGHLAIIRALRERAAIDGIGDLAPDIIRATKARYALRVSQAALIAQMDAAARAVGIPLQQAIRDDAEPPDEVRPADDEQKGDFPIPKGNSVPV